MIEFFNRLFGRPSSSSTAKERLRLVLLSDHIALAPDVVAALKADLLEVISRYVDIDRDLSDISFEQHDRSVAMLASVPVLGMKPQAPRIVRPPDEPGRRPVPLPSVVPQVVEMQAGAVAVAEPPGAGETADAPAEVMDEEIVDELPAVTPEPDPERVTEAIASASVASGDDESEREVASAREEAERVEQLALGHPVPQAGRRKRKRRATAGKAAGNAAKSAAGVKPAAAASPATG